MAARDIVYFDGLRKLFYIKKRRDRWELPLPAWTWGPVLLFPFFPCSCEVDEAHNPASLPFPWCWESPEQHRAASRPASSPLQPPRDTPWWGCPLLQPPSSSRWAPACSLLPLSPKSLALLGWYPWAGGHHPVPGGTQKLIAASLCSSSDNEKSSRAAASLLGNMWQYTKLHRDFKVVRTSLLRGPGAGPRSGTQRSQGQGLRPGKLSHPDASGRTARSASLPLPPEEVGTSPRHRPLGGRRLEEWGQRCPCGA